MKSNYGFIIFNYPASRRDLLLKLRLVDADDRATEATDREPRCERPDRTGTTKERKYEAISI